MLCVLALVLSFVCAAGRPGADSPEDHAIWRIVALIDYVAADYGGAFDGPWRRS
jgi:hypothetical protein